MKNLCISLLVCVIISLTAVAVLTPVGEGQTHVEYLRIHIRANSNSEQEQAVKYEVRDEVIRYLTPYIAECDTKAKAESMIKSKLARIQEIADQVLKANGFSYKSTARVCEEKFPTRAYGNLTLEGGYYDALIIELGSGVGDNWWCVAYPPLCFVGNGEGYVYKSKIYQIINEFFKDKGGNNEKNN